MPFGGRKAYSICLMISSRTVNTSSRRALASCVVFAEETVWCSSVTISLPLSVLISSSSISSEMVRKDPRSWLMRDMIREREFLSGSPEGQALREMGGGSDIVEVFILFR